MRSRCRSTSLSLPFGIELLNVHRGVDTGGLPEEKAVAAVLRAHDIRVVANTSQEAASQQPV